MKIRLYKSEDHVPPAEQHSDPTTSQDLNAWERLKSIAQAFEAQTNAYWDVLSQLAIFGTSANLPELEYFWHPHAQPELAKCWKEAIQAWCEHDILRIQPADPSSGRAVMKVVFSNPKLPEQLTKAFDEETFKDLKAQAAMALLECYDAPTHDQMWRTAEFWLQAGDIPTFIQTCQQSAEHALELGCHSACFERFERIGEYFDQMLQAPDEYSSLQHAIDWPTTLVSAAQNADFISDDKAFERHCQRLKTWAKQTRQVIWLAHIHRLHALHHIRLENYPHALELSETGYEKFMKCHAPLEAQRMHLFKADAETGMGNPEAARQTLENTLQAFIEAKSELDIAKTQARLCQLEWFAGHMALSEQLAQDAYQVFHQFQALSDKSQLQVWMHFVAFISEPQSAHLCRLLDSISPAEDHCDDVSLASAYTCLLIANALHNNWECIEDTLQKIAQKDTRMQNTSILSGTMGCLRALDLAIHGDPFQAADEITFAIASFGPQNRRARAWCHTLLGIHAILIEDLNLGIQSFERAQNDFRMLGDKFGEISVQIGRGALYLQFERHSEATEVLQKAFDEAYDMRLYPHMSIAFALAAYQGAATDSKLSDSFLKTEFTVTVPVIFRSYWKANMEYALNTYSTKSTFEAEKDKIQRLNDAFLQILLDEETVGFPSLEIEM